MTGGGRLLHHRRIQLSDLIHLVDGSIDFLKTRRLFLSGSRNLGDEFVDLGDPRNDALQRRFVIRQSFGCAGPAPTVQSSVGATGGEGLAAWSWGDKGKSLKLTLAPADWTGSPMVAGGADSWEAAEGFWLPRPWLRADGCPGVLSEPETDGATAASLKTVGLAAVFEKYGSRLGRRNGRAYEFTVRAEGDQAPVAPTNGYRLVLEGRMTAFADGRAIRCRAAGPDQRRVCIGAVQLDRSPSRTLKARVSANGGRG